VPGWAYSTTTLSINNSNAPQNILTRINHKFWYYNFTNLLFPAKLLSLLFQLSPYAVKYIVLSGLDCLIINMGRGFPPHYAKISPQSDIMFYLLSAFCSPPPYNFTNVPFPITLLS
jgi:hypothetical protein